MDKSNPLWPFAAQKFGDTQYYCMSVEDRLHCVMYRMDRKALEAALLVPDLQKTVEQAVREKLKKMEVKQ